jgi:hypothetical protein
MGQRCAEIYLWNPLLRSKLSHSIEKEKDEVEVPILATLLTCHIVIARSYQVLPAGPADAADFIAWDHVAKLQFPIAFAGGRVTVALGRLGWPHNP